MPELRKIPVSEPFIDARETEYINDALASKAISGFFGDYIPRFEQGFARFCGSKDAVAVSNGTTALHLALVALGITSGDEILVSTLTNMATFFAVLYQDAVPVPIDIDPITWNLDPALLERKITAKTKAILVVHLFGHPVNMGPVMEIAKKHKLKVIEDCAESHGADCDGKRTGSIGDIGCFSFYANKIITTGEGGMCTTNDPALAKEMRSLRSLAFGYENKFMHRAVGYNYRMTNIQAAMGCAQLEKVEHIVQRKREIAQRYTERLQGNPLLQLPVEEAYARNVYWMYHLALQGRASGKRTVVMKNLADRGIETREGFVPFNMQEIFIAQGLTTLADCPLANDVALRSFYLPSSPNLNNDDIDYIADQFLAVLHEL